MKSYIGSGNKLLLSQSRLLWKTVYKSLYLGNFGAKAYCWCLNWSLPYATSTDITHDALYFRFGRWAVEGATEPVGKTLTLLCSVASMGS